MGSRGDVQPFVAFGAALRGAGREREALHPPGFEPLVRGRGLEFAPLAEVPRAETEEGRRWAEHGSPPDADLGRPAARRPLRGPAADAQRGGGHRRRGHVIVATNLTQVLGWQLARERGAVCRSRADAAQRARLLDVAPHLAAGGRRR